METVKIIYIDKDIINNLFFKINLVASVFPMLDKDTEFSPLDIGLSDYNSILFIFFIMI